MKNVTTEMLVDDSRCLILQTDNGRSMDQQKCGSESYFDLEMQAIDDLMDKVGAVYVRDRTLVSLRDLNGLVSPGWTFANEYPVTSGHPNFERLSRVTPLLLRLQEALKEGQTLRDLGSDPEYGERTVNVFLAVIAASVDDGTGPSERDLACEVKRFVSSGNEIVVAALSGDVADLFRRLGIPEERILEAKGCDIRPVLEEFREAVFLSLIGKWRQE